MIIHLRVNGNTHHEIETKENWSTTQAVNRAIRYDDSTYVFQAFNEDLEAYVYAKVTVYDLNFTLTPERRGSADD